MAAQPAENVPLRSDVDEVEPNNPEKPKPDAVAAAAAPKPQEEQKALGPGEPRQKDAQDYVESVGVACNKCYNWFPIGLFGWIGGWVLVVCCVTDLIVIRCTFTQFFVIALLFCGAVIMLLVEMPSKIVRKQRGLQKVQLALYEWLKLLSRMWGKAVYCIILVIMCFSEMGDGFRSIPWIAGIYLSVLIALYFIFGLLAAKKYNGLYAYIEKSAPLNENISVSVDFNVDIDQKDAVDVVDKMVTDDGDALRKIFSQKFDEIDQDEDGRVGPKDIARLGVEANLELSNSECHAIVCYLDDDCNGDIVKDDWIRMWLKNSRLVWM